MKTIDHKIYSVISKKMIWYERTSFNLFFAVANDTSVLLTVLTVLRSWRRLMGMP